MIGLSPGSSRDGVPSELAGRPVVVREAPVSRAALRDLAADVVAGMGSGPRAFDHQIDAEVGVVEFFAVDRATRGRLHSAIDASPARGRGARGVVREVPALSRPSTDIWGGLALSTCTSGFSIQHTDGYSNVRAVLTAGHCGSAQSRLGTSLPYLTEGMINGDDWQSHSAPAFTVGPYFFEGVANRRVYGYNAAVPQIGDFVCKYGKSAGYMCGTTNNVSYNPSYIIGDCNCVPVAHNSSNGDMSVDGDSGGPVFNGNYAYGLVSGGPSGAPNDLIYSSSQRIFGAQSTGKKFVILT